MVWTKLTHSAIFCSKAEWKSQDRGRETFFLLYSKPTKRIKLIISYIKLYQDPYESIYLPAQEEEPTSSAVIRDNRDIWRVLWVVQPCFYKKVKIILLIIGRFIHCELPRFSDREKIIFHGLNKKDTVCKFSPFVQQEQLKAMKDTSTEAQIVWIFFLLNYELKISNYVDQSEQNTDKATTERDSFCSTTSIFAQIFTPYIHFRTP